MKIIVGMSNGQEYELSKDESYTDARKAAAFVNMTGHVHLNFFRAKDGRLLMPKQVVYIREEEE